MKQVIVTTEGDEIVAEARVAETGLLPFLAPWILRKDLLIYIEGNLMSEEERQRIVELIEEAMAKSSERTPTPAPSTAPTSTTSSAAPTSAAPTSAAPSTAAPRVPTLDTSAAETAAVSLELLKQPERLKNVVEVVNSALHSGLTANLRMSEELWKAQVANFNTLNTVIARYGQLSLEQSQQLATEHVRQRGLMHQSLADVDLLDRSVATKRITDRFARVAAPVQVAASASHSAPPPVEPERGRFSFESLLHGAVRAIQKLSEAETKE
jgi:hypothetical protein